MTALYPVRLLARRLLKRDLYRPHRLQPLLFLHLFRLGRGPSLMMRCQCTTDNHLCKLQLRRLLSRSELALLQCLSKKTLLW